jgi:1-aminocyclopropane-1-carboxylate deaminase/D-cysteine desulfhydrase-like pyridoxal-dependent ACC family enzyme
MPAIPVPFAAIVHRQKKIVATFRTAGATSANHAATTATLGIQEGLAFRILVRHAILRDAGEQRVYLDEPRWEAHQQRRRRLAVVIPGVVLLCAALTAAIAFWISRR